MRRAWYWLKYKLRPVRFDADADLEGALEEARQRRAADIERLNDMVDDEVVYLSRVGELADPLSDGIGCEH